MAPTNHKGGLKSVIQMMRGTPAKPASDRMSEQEAADWLGVSVFTLQRIRKRGEIGHAKVGNRAQYTAKDLQSYVDSKSSKPCPKTVFKSVTTTSPSTKTPLYGKPHGTTPLPDKQSALALAQKTFKTPKSA